MSNNGLLIPTQLTQRIIESEQFILTGRSTAQVGDGIGVQTLREFGVDDANIQGHSLLVRHCLPRFVQ